jgi:hypothetical protein
VRKNAVELHEKKGDKEALELMVKHIKFETIGEKEHRDKIEQGVKTVYNHLSISVQGPRVQVHRRNSIIFPNHRPL